MRDEDHDIEILLGDCCNSKPKELEYWQNGTLLDL